MKVIMSGGGTGGHVNPAIAIADTIKAHEPQSEISFVGTSRGIENKLVPAQGYELHHIEIRGIRRSLSPSNIKTAYLALTSVAKAERLLTQRKPDIAIGTGGYACWPVIRAAAKLGIPTALHESNAVPGVAVKMLEKHVDRIFVNFEETLSHLKYPEKAVRVGNPLRGAFSAFSHEEARTGLKLDGKYRSMILSCGGSMGAERINAEILTVMRDFTSRHPDILHIHATGAIEYRASKEMYDALGLAQYANCRLTEYIYDMPLQMAAADLVINRAGAMTLSELAILKKPCILIPSPNVTNNHQYKNAAALARKDAALLLEERELNGGRLTREIAALIGDRERLYRMSENISSFAVKDCNNLIYSDLKKLVFTRNT
ncbi:MAG: undecaprenyldiphospho-muramoylpentapeptide beta-N-acetylglucosaminyltransferase [Eubacteriales bacterium]|jgi:UDP-N-acetylglucosamine--N-acetylmuramyl-(pentapeptide) pyrophosphoryl-undecaprenol N-acetylglucosamine transferase|nr:undecaprenyldiphospho-muramoylpentapeptide beta-N-acetylglucosaminyltransferase [Eubacteriales bacterium]